MYKSIGQRLVGLFAGILVVLGPSSARAQAADSSLVVRSVSNASLEILLKYRSGPSENPANLVIYVSDFATNAPVSGAQLKLRTTTPATISTTAVPVRPGVYEPHLAYPRAGDYTLVIAVSGSVSGEFVLTRLPLGYTPRDTTQQTQPVKQRRSIIPLAVIGVALAGLLFWILRQWRGRSWARRSRAAALMIVAVIALDRGVARAHAGHDTAPGTAAGGTGPRYVAKESQFLLAIRTLPLKLEQLRSQLSAVGHVVPGTGAWTTIAAPQSGRFDGIGRTWTVGDRVQRGQLLGYLQVIDRLPVRAPISGLIAEVAATPGQWVQAGQPLMRVLDPSHLRVEVPLFGENLTRGLAARTATVHLTAVPGRTFPARVRGLAPTVSDQSLTEGSPAAGSAAASPVPPLLLDVVNAGGLLRPGMLVEVSLETAVSRAVMAVPQSAIVHQETGPGIFVHTAPELFEFRAVSIGDRYVDRVGVSGELKPGDRVVTQGAYSLIAAPPASAPVAGGPR